MGTRCGCPYEVSATRCMEIRYSIEAWEEPEECECPCHYAGADDSVDLDAPEIPES